jgi:hypothetical protein
MKYMRYAILILIASVISAQDIDQFKSEIGSQTQNVQQIILEGKPEVAVETLNRLLHERAIMYDKYKKLNAGMVTDHLDGNDQRNRQLISSKIDINLAYWRYENEVFDKAFLLSLISSSKNKSYDEYKNNIIQLQNDLETILFELGDYHPDLRLKLVKLISLIKNNNEWP